MEFNIGWEGVAVITAVVIHAFATIWWASKITTMLDHLREEVARLNRELEKKDEITERMWTRIDELRDRIKGG